MLNEMIMAKLLENIDFSKYSKDIEKALDEYFKSDRFKEDFSDALNNEGLAEEIGEYIAKGYIASMKQHSVSITITTKPAKK